MSCEVLLDPAYMACRCSSGDIRALEDYALSLADVFELIEDECHLVLLPQGLWECLTECDLVPDWSASNVHRLDVMALFTAIVDRSIDIALHVRLADVVVDAHTFSPPLQASIHPGPMAAALVQSLAIWALGVELKSFDKHLVSPILLTPAPSGAAQEFAAVVTGYQSATETVIPDKPVEVRESFAPAQTEADVRMSVEPVWYWLAGCLREAILCWAEREGWEGEPHPFSFHPSFAESLRRLRLVDSSENLQRTMRACAETVFEKRLADTHPIRVDRGGNSAQLIRRPDGAAAWRRDIDHEYHLHYWKTGATIQLTTVVRHNDFSIPS